MNGSFSERSEAPIPFLQAVAEAALSRYDNLSRVCFVFPNRRAGMFFLRYLASASRNPLLAPEVMAIADFTARLSGHDVDSRIDMLFRLYNVYCRLLADLSKLSDSGKDFKPLVFDRFASWGEVILADFSEVDQYMVDAEKVFDNVRDFREISSNFLTDEQREMIERFFGYSPALEDVEGFWKHVGPGSDEGIRARFLELWQLLPELYERLRADLEADGLCMPGSAFRLAVERLNDGEEDFPYDKVVFVGFNALSTSENLLFEELAARKSPDGSPLAEFFWDATGPVLTNVHGKITRELRRNEKRFPSPEWSRPFLERAATKQMPPVVTIAASPSNSTQTKIAGEKLKELLNVIGKEKFKDAKVAVVLPDENLLLPLLYSLPREIGEVNLTMGHSLRFTAIASFIYHIRRLFQRRRAVDGREAYYYEDLKLFLAHPLTHAVAGSDEANAVAGHIMNTHCFTLSVEEIASISPAVARLLRPLPRNASPTKTVEWLDHLLNDVDEALAAEASDESGLKKTLERSQIIVYRNALSRLLDAICEHHIMMGPESVLLLADRLLAGEKITFEGEPLEGLQVMGILETRALDFEHLIVLSMNDKVMPRSGGRRTFIPDALRRGYGLPAGRSGEALYAYYFYRMLSRSRGVDLIYDARAGEGMRSGGKSRFLLQLELLHARDRVRMENYSYQLNASPSKAKPIVKSPAVIDELLAFTRKESGRNLSASALVEYCNCPVRFYYKFVKGIRDEVEPGNFISPIVQGDIVHDVMLSLYFPAKRARRMLRKPIVISRQQLEAMASDRRRIMRLIVEGVNKHHFHLPEEKRGRDLPEGVAMVAEKLADMVEGILRYDASRGELVLVGGEVPGKTRMKIGDAPEVNFSYAFDRVDRTPDGGYRIVDYKTGGVHLEAAKPENILDGSYKAKNILQLLLYSNLLARQVGSEVAIAPEIYEAQVLPEGGASRPKVDRTVVTDYRQVNDEFLSGLSAKLKELFDPEIPLGVADDDDRCSHCRLQSLCGR